MSTAEVYSFIQQIAPLIVAEGNKRGYKVMSTVIAQAIIESRYGKSTLASKYHNYFGLKCGTAWVLTGKPSVSLKTNEEYTPGKLTAIKDAFRVYPDMPSGVAGYYDFISSKRYANLKTAINYRQYAEYLKADGYATSSTYVNTLCTTVSQYGLEVYDHAQSIVSCLWEVGKTYTTQQDLNVRQTPNGELLPFERLTEDGKAHAIVGPSGNAILKRGTKVTVKEIREEGSCVWLRIPSGWICGKNSKTVYVL
jgi:hypothetical protein